ncbi:SDR family NAD(P)-dependent oxidoreductase [Variovorax sp. DT-64]|uniref:type I polyketide synthase n=1 Tax=Variovorax sp. DT-64 TaxID=3396160 RepID=UPI003F1B05E0
MQEEDSMQGRDGLTGLEIAVVGMAGRFPGAKDIDAFWRNLRDGVESVATYTDEQLRARGVSEALLADPDYVKAGVVFEGADQFDASFFGYTPREAEQLDPQHRIFLECAWEAVEHAGYDPQQWPGAVGVFAGPGASVYLMRHLLPQQGGLDAGSRIADLLALVGGSSAESLCTRVAYKLNLRGPAMTVQTACSTSLAAVHLACQSLLAHECEMALAGGVSLNLLQNGGYRYQAGAILSPDGHCRAFDAKAAGTLLGSGAGVVVLKRLEDALRERDTIHAVIKATAANNDGADKIGFTAPGVAGQAAAIRAAQLLADVPAETIGYVEAHGTGTTLGDPIEVAALTQAFRAGTQRRGFCAIGSVKTNIGHLDCAAGVAGLIKTVLALRHGTLPASLHFEAANPKIDFDGSPFHVNAATRPWPRGDGPLRAGVSAFGIGGTNVHAVLEEAPATQDRSEGEGEDEWQVLPVSAAGDSALREAIERLAGHLETHPEMRLADVAHTLQCGRRAWAHRGAVVAKTAAEAAQALRVLELPPAAPVAAQTPEVVFLFPGGGAQHANMGAALYRRHAVFRDEIDRCCAFLRAEIGIDLREHLFPAPGQESLADEALFRMALAQPALFVVDYAMARLWMSRGVQPALMLGHSLGEYVAACLAGVFSLEDALRIVAARGRLLASMGEGAMTSVALPEAQLRPFLAEGCDLAAVNAEQMCVLAGPLQRIEAVERELAARMQVPRRLHVAVASHSAMTEPVMAELEKLVASVPRHAPRIPFISNVSGKPITPEQATDPHYWARHLRATVRFAEGLGEALRVPGRVLLEVGPGDSLTGLARLHPLHARCWASQGHVQQQARNEQQFAQATAGLWCAGVAVDWAACRAGALPRRVPLPTYPFQRRRYWIEAGSLAAVQEARAAGSAARRPADWLHRPAWRRTPASAPPAAQGGSVLVLGEGAGLAQGLLRALQAQGRTVVLAEPAEAFSRLGPLHYRLRIGEREDHERLLREAEADAAPVTEICHLWSLDDDAAARAAMPALLERGYFSLLALAQALGAAPSAHAQRKRTITVVASQVADVAGIEALCPEKALLLGPCKVIPQEWPELACRLIDVLPPAHREAQDRLAAQIVAEMGLPAGESPVALRGPHRWTRVFEAAGVQPEAVPPRLRRGGVFLVTGGLGGIGMELARYLASAWQARLVLIGRSAVPAREHWPALLVAEPPDSPLRARLQRLQALEAEGAEFLALQADVSDPTQLEAALAQARQRFGAIHGVIHAAGEPGGGVIANRTRAAVAKVFAPKVQGTRVLMEALRGDAPDFVLLCSSLSAIAGGFGQVDYCAANCFLDAFAAEAGRRPGPFVLSVNWDAWRGVGMAAGQTLPEDVGIAPGEGGALLELLLAGPAVAQTIVSTSHLERQLAQMATTELADRLLPAPAGRRQTHARPALSTHYVPPEGELEQDLALLCSEFLGIAPIGMDDSLFELGGDSLVAIQILARARSAYGVALHPAAFFRTPTVRALALLVETCLIEDIENTDPGPAGAPDLIAEKVEHV